MPYCVEVRCSVSLCIALYLTEDGNNYNHDHDHTNEEKEVEEDDDDDNLGEVRDVEKEDEIEGEDGNWIRLDRIRSCPLWIRI